MSLAVPHPLDVFRQRRSVRQFLQQPVPRDLLLRVIEAGTWAPSAGNRQAWEFTLVTSATTLQAMAEVVRCRWETIMANLETSGIAEELAAYHRNFDWFSSVPVVIAVSARTPEAFLEQILGADAIDVSGAKTSAAMAAENLMLAAQSLGLGSCCLTGPLAAQQELKHLLGLGKRQSLVCLIALGYPAQSVAEPGRKPVEDVMRIIE